MTFIFFIAVHSIVSYLILPCLAVDYAWLLFLVTTVGDVYCFKCLPVDDILHIYHIPRSNTVDDVYCC